MTRQKNLLDVALVAAALLGAAYLGATTDLPRQAELDARPGHVLPAFSQNAVSRITITRGEQEIVLRRAASDDPDAYFLGGSGQQLADPEQVHELISSLSFATYLRRFAAGEQPALSTLGAPQIKVQVQAGARSFVLYILNRTPVSLDAEHAQFFVQIEFAGGAPTYGVVDEDLFLALSISEQKLRGNALFPFSIQETNALVLAHPGQPEQPELSLVADKLGFFVSTEGATFRADRVRTDLVFFHLARANLSQFVDDKIASQGILQDPARVVLTQKGPGQNVVVELGGACPSDPTQILALRRGSAQIAGCVSQSISPATTWNLDLLKDKTATLLTADEIDHVVLQAGAKSVNIMRRDAGFIALHRERESISTQAGEDFFHVFSDGTMQLVRAPKKADEAPYALTISGVLPQKALDQEPWLAKDREQNDREHATRMELEVHHMGPESVLLHRLDDDAWLLVPTRYHWAFSLDDGWSRNRKLETPSAEQIKWVTLEGSAFSKVLGTKPSQTVKRYKDSFYVVDQPEVTVTQTTTQADSTLTRRLLDELTHLEALRYVPDQSRPLQGYMHISFAAGASLTKQDLWIGARTSGGYLAWASFAEGTFVLPYQTVERLGFSLTDRSVAQLSPESLRRISVQSGDRYYAFESSEGQWHPVGGDAEERMVVPLVEALRGLEVVSHTASAPSGESPILEIVTQDAPSSLAEISEQRTEGGSNESTNESSVAADEAGTRRLRIYSPAVFRSLSVYRATVDGVPGAFLMSAAGVDELRALF